MCTLGILHETLYITLRNNYILAHEKGAFDHSKLFSSFSERISHSNLRLEPRERASPKVAAASAGSASGMSWTASRMMCPSGA